MQMIIGSRWSVIWSEESGFVAGAGSQEPFVSSSRETTRNALEREEERFRRVLWVQGLHEGQAVTGGL